VSDINPEAAERRVASRLRAEEEARARVVFELPGAASWFIMVLILEKKWLILVNPG